MITLQTGAAKNVDALTRPLLPRSLPLCALLCVKYLSINAEDRYVLFSTNLPVQTIVVTTVEKKPFSHRSHLPLQHPTQKLHDNVTTSGPIIFKLYKKTVGHVLALLLTCLEHTRMCSRPSRPRVVYADNYLALSLMYARML